MRKLKLDELGRTSVTAFQAQPKIPVVIVLDNIRSGMNVGAVFRTADGFAMEHIYLTGITPTPPHKEILKTAIGASKSMSWSYERNVSDCVQHLKRNGYRIIIIEQTDCSVPMHEFDVSADAQYALVLGNEVNGVSEEVLSLADIALEIPMRGTKHSFNISVCAGIVMWDFARAWL